MKSAAGLAFCQLIVIGTVVASQLDILARVTSTTQPSNSSVPTITPLIGNSSNATTSPPLSTHNSTIANATSTSSSSNSTFTSSTPAPTNDAQAKDAAENCDRSDLRMDPNNTSPFCFPKDKDKVYVGNTTYFVWDHKQYDSDAKNNLTLDYYGQDHGPDGFSQVAYVVANNTQGWAKIKMEEKWLEGNTSTNFTVFMSIISQNDSDNSANQSGPIISLVDNKSEKDEDSKKPSKLGMGLGIPIAFAFIALGIAVVFFCMRKRRRAGGYLAKRSLSQGSGRNRAVHLEDDDWSGGTRGPERFRDEPGPGLELQDRSRGYDRDDSIGSLGSSPTHDGFESQGQTGGNAFRDEISRQRDKNR